ncbi:hypothetical protein M3E18_10135 [Kocuria sp. p3-SID1433]|uniref:hypothetical protein n=1 Tax=unclassified Kocuria TaxID=2649579 RepID=UPI0021A2EC00|nr:MULTISPECIES: hypothetical protein [unclassified Kocuria]MCT1601386.1 hypothetical protein [Kocuria sp. p3-SID1428]MCT2180885.1 hypothetical protein [Kocuria sp. p3-SID1433]
MSEAEQTSAPQRQESAYGSEAVHRWADLEAFHASSEHGDGYHVIERAHGAPLELLTIGQPFEQLSGAVLVVFSGAVGKRKARKPPFVSGRSLGPQLGVPLIAISDPTLALRGDLNIAWYAGSVFQDVQRAVEELLRPLAVRLDGDLWLIGGSAGGFGALQTAHRLGRFCSAFVWNPQTDIASYMPLYARRYGQIAFPQLAGRLGGKYWKSLFRKEARDQHRCVDLVRETIPAQSPRRLLYLQSITDSHLKGHCVPYLRQHGYRRHSAGLWTRGENQVIWQAETGIGHAPPSAAAIRGILTRLLASDDATVLERVEQLDEAPTFDGRAVAERPESFEAQAELLSGLLSWRVTGRRIVAESKRLPSGFGRMRWSAVVRDAQDKQLSRSTPTEIPGDWVIPSLEGADHADVVLSDGFGKVLLRRTLRLSR